MVTEQQTKNENPGGAIFIMADTFSQITLHVVFAVKHRENFITENWRDNLHQYISGIITHKGAKSLAVGGWKDHVHILLWMPVTISISDFVGAVKANSSKWINEQQFVKGKFQWQEGYAAFSYSKSQRDVVIKYIINQQEHHRSKSFREEYMKMLSDFEIEYNDKYLFEFYDL